MNRSLGWGAAAVIAIAAIFGVSRQGGEDRAPEGGRQAAVATDAGKAGNSRRARDKEARNEKHKSALDDDSGCARIEDALQTFFLIPDDDKSNHENVQAPTECYPDQVNHSSSEAADWNLAGDAHYMIALLPDPIHTHLAGTFDQLTESIEHAVQAENFNYDSSWLPWGDPEPPRMLLGDELQAKRLRDAEEEQPGILLFRNATLPSGNYNSALVVFVVGERSTAGVNKKQFENAVGWIQYLKNLKDKNAQLDQLTILGPYSSGSFDSLAQLLAGDGPLAGSVKSLRMASGTASDEKSILKFQTAMGGRLETQRVVTFQENTKLEIKRYLRLLAIEGYGLNRVAVVSEDETSFGDLDMYDPQPKTWDSSDKAPSASRPSNPPSCRDQTSLCEPGLTLSYPRDISGLRGAYQKQGLMNPQTNRPDYTNRQRFLPEDLGESGEEADDTVKTYSGGQVDLSDEGELLQIVLQLQQKDIEYVLLVSSNTLDQIFLSRFLRAAYPSARVVILGANQSLFRGESASESRGVLTLTPYPLSPVVQAWTTPGDTVERDIFTTDLAQGVYYATRYLLEVSPAAGNADRKSPLPGYAAPRWIEQDSGTCVPPTWLTVISAGRPWPVAALDDRTLRQLPTHKIMSTQPAPCAPEWPDPHSLLESPQWLLCGTNADPTKSGKGNGLLKLPFEYCFAVIACVLWMLVHWWLRLNASVVLRPRCRAFFELTDSSLHALFLNLAWACIGIAALALFWFARYATAVVGHAEPSLYFLVATAIICAVFPVVDWLRAKEDFTTSGKRRDYPGGIAGAACALVSPLVLLAFVWAFWRFLPGYNEAGTIPEQWRAVNVLSGVSPAVPIVLLAIGAYFWCIKNLHCLALFNVDKPQLPLEDELRIDSGKGECSDPEAASPCERSRMLKMFAAEAYKNVKLWGFRLNRVSVCLFAGVLLLLLGAARVFRFHLRDLGARSYGDLFGCALLVFFAVMLTQSVQLFALWQSLQELLGYLDRIRLRRTMRSIGSFDWKSVWTMGGAVLDWRYQMLSRQLETLHHLDNAWEDTTAWPHGSSHRHEVRKAMDDLNGFVRCVFAPWYAKTYRIRGPIDLEYVWRVQRSIAALSGALFTHVLLPAWAAETESLILGPTETKSEVARNGPSGMDSLSNSLLVRTAEEFVCLNYLAFIQNAAGRLRSVVIGLAWLFLAATVASAAYPFDPQPMLSKVFSVVFVLLAGTVIFVYAQAHRDATLSHITNTKPGELGEDFYLKVLQFGIGPAIGLISVLFPSFANLLFSWIQTSPIK
jgi:hypothetical protein